MKKSVEATFWIFGFIIKKIYIYCILNEFYSGLICIVMHCQVSFLQTDAACAFS